jgi:Ig-like domain CHU_C associated
MLRFSQKYRTLSSRLGSLLLLFQRTPLVQFLLPEARLISSAGLGEITLWTVATIAGLGAYDTVAGASAILQVIPDSNLSTVSATTGTPLNFVFNFTSTKAYQSWSYTGALPAGLTFGNSNINTNSISGTPTQSGSFPIRVTIHSGPNQTSYSYSENFTINVAAPIVAPSITGQPTSVSINSGETATFTVTAAGTSPTFQWFTGNTGDTANPVVPAATTATFITPPLTTTTNYWVRATNSEGSADSTTATATVIAPFVSWTNSIFPVGDRNNPLITGPSADPDGDGITNTSEYLLGLSPLSANPPPTPQTTLANNQISLKFTARAATGPGYTGRTRRYALEANNTLDPTSWAPVVGYTDILASDQSITYTPANSSTLPRQFYRLKIILTP